ncbi:MAG: NAD(P)H-hydrate dehydratase [Clostridia bacterium]|nr:NAD(P)H-hydrate dehydratase [Clostridia bacterium]
MQRVLDVATMRKSDAETIRGGISGRELMWRAARGVFESYPWQGRVAIVCGSGNNAGDGFALALLLTDAKIDCTLFLLSERFSADGAYYYGKCKEIGVKVSAFSQKGDFSEYTEIVDCIFGTGFRGDAEGLAADAIQAINQSNKTVISVDINSGLNGDNGCSSLCVRSHLTVSVGFYKNGHFLNQAKDMIQRHINVDIGIGLHGACRYLLEARDVANILKPRLQNSHKGDYGYVSILGGCTQYSGAVKLANLSCAALRSGCGVAQLIVPQSLAVSVSPYLLESTLALLPDKDGQMCFDPAALDRVLEKQKALAIGMGWGNSPQNQPILTYILQNYAIPLVIDADGLNTLAKTDLLLLKQTKCRVLLTPHAKEMERLSGIPIAQIIQDPIGIAERFAKEYGVTLLLKGATTVITDGERTYLVDRGCAGMATAGSGDVLSGILVGLLGYAECTPLTAACGAYIAGRAGELAQDDVNPISMTASDTVSHIVAAITEIIKENSCC